MIEKHVQRIVKQVVQDHLQSGHVVDVLADRGEDFDGDDIIRVTVVVNAPASAFDPKKLAGLVSHLRDALGEVHEYDFPMVNYVDQREFDLVIA